MRRAIQRAQFSKTASKFAIKPRPGLQRRSRQVTTNLFTGIVQGVGTVVSVDQKPDFSSIGVRFPNGRLQGIQVGASVAVNGTCLTVTSVAGDEGCFDIIAETLRATTLGSLQRGSLINFERSARVGDEIGGHNVSGHVHTTAEISNVEETPDNRRLTLKVPEIWNKYILPKGFIAVDGISLTVGEVGDGWFSLYLIPETLRVTILGKKNVGDSVNIEIDSQTQAIVDTVEQVVGRHLASLPQLAQAVRV